MNATPVRTRNFTWSFNLNFDHNESVVERLVDLDGDGEDDISTLQIGGFTGTGIYHVVGQPYGQVFGGAYLRNTAGTDLDDGTAIPEGSLVINDDPTSSEYRF